MGDAVDIVDLGTNYTAVEIAAGKSHTCARLDSGQIKCWGKNDLGQLGQGDTYNRGDGEVNGKMGDALPVVELLPGRTAVQVACGGSTSCAVLDNGQVVCWGSNGSGQLGHGD